MKEGTEGLRLHGGRTPYDPLEAYHYQDGEMRGGITVVSWALTSMLPHEGGFLVVPGSHKANFPYPGDLSQNQGDWLTPVPLSAGDVVVFTSAITHGTQIWSAHHQRRSLIFKYAPGHVAFDSGYLSCWPQSLKHMLSEQQRRLLDPPYDRARDALSQHSSAGAAQVGALGRT